MRPLSERKAMIERQKNSLTISHQCQLLGVHRSGLYYQPCPESEENLTIMRLLDEQYFKTPFYGIRKLTVWLAGQGYKVNRKRVKRLMARMGWQTLYRRPAHTSDPDKRKQAIPLYAEEPGYHQNQPGVGDGYHLCSHAQGIYVFVCHHRRLYPLCNELECE